MILATSIRFEVPGAPVAKERPRLGRGGRVFTPDRTTQFEESVAWSAIAAGARFGAGPVEVKLEFHCRPSRGDLDNLAKSVLDGLVKARAINDDSATVVSALDIRFVECRDDERTLVEIFPSLEAVEA